MPGSLLGTGARGLIGKAWIVSAWHFSESDEHQSSTPPDECEAAGVVHVRKERGTVGDRDLDGCRAVSLRMSGLS